MLRILCALVVIGAASADFSMPRFYAKYSMTGSPNVNSFYSVPRTEKEAIELDWIVPNETVHADNVFNTYCNPIDNRFCILTDLNGIICGYQISVSAAVDKLEMPDYDFIEKGFKRLVLFGKEMYANQIFFVSQDVIKSGGRKLPFDGQTGDGLYLQVGEKLLNVPHTEAEMNTTLFKRQNCFPRMGQHYFYDVRHDLTAKDFKPWFTLFDHNGVLFGFGFLALGPEPVPEGSISLFEDVSEMAIKMIAPDVPDWVIQYLKKYGLTAHHMYFGEEPWNIKCKNFKLDGLKY